MTPRHECDKIEIILGRRRHMSYGHPFGVTRILSARFFRDRTRSGDFVLSLAKSKKRETKKRQL
jgi:hypothetical protein